MASKWIHASKAGMNLTGAMVKDGRIRMPAAYRARARAYTAEDLAEARRLRLAGHKEAARIRLTYARQDRIFITTGAPPIFG